MKEYTKEYLKEVFNKEDIAIHYHLRNSIIKTFNKDMEYFSKFFKLFNNEIFPLIKEDEMYFDFSDNKNKKCSRFENYIEGNKYVPQYNLYKNIKENYKIYNDFINLLSKDEDNKYDYIFNELLNMTIFDLEEEYHKLFPKCNKAMFEIIYDLLSGTTRRYVENCIKDMVEKRLIIGTTFYHYDEENVSNNVYKLNNILDGEDNEKIYLLEMVIMEGEQIETPIYAVKSFYNLFIDYIPEYPHYVFFPEEYDKMNFAFKEQVLFFLDKFGVKNYNYTTFDSLYDNKENIEKNVADYIFFVFLDYYMMYNKLLSSLKNVISRNVYCISNVEFDLLKKKYKWLVNKDRKEIYNTLVKGKIKENILFLMFFE